jgi:hypothetical protein
MKRHSAIDLQLIRTTAGERVLRGLSIVRLQISPRAHLVSRAIGVRLAKIHRTQNHAKLARDTLISNGVGLLMGMLSAQFVSQFFAVKGIHNLWGILSKQTMVSDASYKALCFGVEFLVALAVFTLTDHFIDEYQTRRKAENEKPDDDGRG